MITNNEEQESLLLSMRRTNFVSLRDVIDLCNFQLTLSGFGRVADSPQKQF